MKHLVSIDDLTKDEIHEIFIQTKKIKYQDLSFIQLHVDGYSKNANNGDAQLPVVQELLNIPYGSQIIVNIIKLINRKINHKGVKNITNSWVNWIWNDLHVFTQAEFEAANPELDTFV